MFPLGKFLRRHWTSETQLVQFMKIYGVEPPSKGAARKWFERDSIPAAWFATIVMLLELHTGKPISLIGYE
ncbi:MAG: hypothetical protein KGL39_05175 [Patescibacteria group bacterium]|nr:hypothetical protein [Patescibacteria group bacterium]